MPEGKKVLREEWGMPTDTQARVNELSLGRPGTIWALRWIMMITDYGPLRVVENHESFQKLIKEFM